jgi:O-antigen/teichoic acid export membrane protein
VASSVHSPLSYLLATLLPRASSFLILLLLTRALPLEQYGGFALVVTVGEMLDAVGVTWILVILVREEAQNGRLGPMFGRVALLGVASLAIMCLVGLPLGPWLGMPGAGLFTLSVLSYAISFGVLRFALTCLQVRNQDSAYAVLEIARSLVTLAAAFALAWLTDRYVPVSLGISFTAAAFALIALRLALRGQQIAFPRDGYVSLLRLGAPLVSANALLLGIQALDRLMLQVFLNSATLGLYTAASALGRQPIDVLANAVNMVGFPALVRAHADANAEASSAVIRQNMLTVLVWCLPMIAMFMAVGAQAVQLILPQPYWESATLLIPLVMLGTLCFALKHFVFENVFHVTRRNWLAAICLVPGTIVAVIAQIVLIPRYGMVGAAISFVVGSAASFVTTMLVSRTLIAADIPWNHILRIVICALVTWSAASLAVHFGSTFGTTPSLVLGCMTGGSAYLASVAVLGLQGAILMEADASHQQYDPGPGSRRLGIPAEVPADAPTK